jgi:flavodoxin I
VNPNAVNQFTIRFKSIHAMKILITYFTQTGNTERIAKAIHIEVSTHHDTTLKKIDTQHDSSCDGFNLVFIGSPCHAGSLAAPVREFLSQLNDNPSFHLAGFITHASPAYSKTDYENCMAYFASVCKKKSITYHGCFECQGNLAPQLHDFVKKQKQIPDEEWNRILTSNSGHPDDGDEINARSFARKVLSDSLT